jgi:mannose/fructose-specific phosphotransferase system component IIA
MPMTHETLSNLLRTNSTVKLITAHNAPLIISFFFRVFKADNRFSIVESD